MTGYLKPMELDSDGVWRRSTNLTSDDIEITDLNLYQTGSQNGQVFNEIDNLKVDDYVVQNRWQPIGAAPVTELGERCFSRSSTDYWFLKSSILTISNPWQRLSRYEMGDLVKHNGSPLGISN